ncbi:hypothetical protein MKX01_037904 [Papaver californicum]|nr:hypothetical protein MKX01_037904 [Papaver californicum]
MEENKWPPALVIPSFILDPMLHSAYLIKSLRSSEYIDIDDDEIYIMYQAFRVKKAPAKALGIEQALDMLITTCRIAEGRFKLGTAKILPVVVELVRFLVSAKPSTHYPLYLSLKLLRNLCGGEILNQNCFLEVDGVDVVAMAVDSVKGKRNYGLEVVKTVLELLGNFCQAGEEHKNVVWFRFFPGAFKNMAKTRERDFLNALCMVVHTCCDGSYEIMGQLYGVQGVQLVAEMVGTSQHAGGVVEDWLLELLDTTCIKGSYLKPLFKELKSQFDVSIDNAVKKSGDLKDDDIKFAHTYLFTLLTARLNKKRSEPNVSKEFALSVLRLFRSAGVDFFSRAKSGLVYINPLDVSLTHKYTSAADLVRHSLHILYHLSKHDLKLIRSPGTSSSSTAEDSVFELLLSSGLVDHLLYYLHQFGPPSVQKFTSSEQLEFLAYAMLRNDIVSFIGKCLKGRKHVQDEIRQKGAILLLLQQCDEDQPLLRLFGLTAVVNLLDGNRENQQALTDLKKDKNIYVPPLAGPGLGVSIDRATARVTFKDRPIS